MSVKVTAAQRELRARRREARRRRRVAKQELRRHVNEEVVKR